MSHHLHFIILKESFELQQSMPPHFRPLSHKAAIVAFLACSFHLSLFLYPNSFPEWKAFPSFSKVFPYSFDKSPSPLRGLYPHPFPLYLPKMIFLSTISWANLNNHFISGAQFRIFNLLILKPPYFLSLQTNRSTH